MLKTKATKTKIALYEAACLLFAKGASPSLAEIATLAGVARATLHRHFSTREQFLNEMARWALSSIEKAGENASYKAKSFEEAFWLIIKALIPMGDKYHFLIRESQTLNCPKVKRAIEKTDQEMNELIAHLQELGVLSPEMTPAWMSSVVDALIYTAWEQVQKGDLAPNAAPDLVRRTLLGGFGLGPLQKNKE